MAYDLYVLELLKRLNCVALAILPLPLLVFYTVDCFTDTGVWTLKSVPLSSIGLYKISVPQNWNIRGQRKKCFGHVPCISRLTGCKRPWRSIQAWEWSNQTIWQTIHSLIRLRLLINSNTTAASRSHVFWINLRANNYFQQLNIWKTNV